VAVNFEEDARRRRWKKVLAQWIRGFYRGGHSGDQRRGTKVYGDAVEGLSHAAHDREAAVDGELIYHSRRARGVRR
jgi:hypothetical protein